MSLLNWRLCRDLKEKLRQNRISKLEVTIICEEREMLIIGTIVLTIAILIFIPKGTL